MSRQRDEGDRQAHTKAWAAGNTFYRSPRLCPKCGHARRYVSSTACVFCVRARAKAQRVADALQQDQPRTRQEAIDRGAAYYFPNRRCRRGHVAKRSVACNTCYECAYPSRK